MADPRAGDVAEAERLFSKAEAEGVAALPTLSAAELWVLCGTDQVLAAEPELRWWNGMSGPDRETLTAAMLDFLAYRKLLRPAGGEQADGGTEGRVPMVAALAMIVAALQHPSVVAAGTAADGSAEDTPRMYGLAEEDQPLRAVVGEYVSRRKATKPFGPLHVFSLMSPRHAGHALAWWATEADTSHGSRRKRSRRDMPQILDFYQHWKGETLTCDRITVAAGDGCHMVTRQRLGASPDPPAACDQAGLAGLLAGMLTREPP